MSREVKIFDTTLRDGEQAPGFSMNIQEKIQIAKALEKLNVDIIEAGFPASSAGDLDAVKAISGTVKNCTIAALCRCVEKDIDAARDALGKAASPRIHVFIATSPIHLSYKLKMTEDEVLARAIDSVKYARRFCDDVEFSAEDAFRSDTDFICRIFGEVIKAGARTVNYPDTVGYALPAEIEEKIHYIKNNTPGIEKAVLSVHCHNDLGLAAANTLSAIKAGADQVECTINGIGERAGNASLEEIVMALKVRNSELKINTRIDSTRLYSVSRLVSQVTGVKVQPNKAIVGDNAFAHESGIHQHGIMENTNTYEIMSPESVGLPRNRMVLGKHSGRHALKERLRDLGLRDMGIKNLGMKDKLDGETFMKIFNEFKNLADKKKTVSDRDIEALVMEFASPIPETWKLDHWAVNTGSALGASGTIRLINRDGSASKRVAMGDGPIDAIYSAINRIIKKEPELTLYELGAITGGSSSQAETMVRISHEGRRWNGRGVSTDVVESSIKAYIAAINAMEWELGDEQKSE